MVDTKVDQDKTLVRMREIFAEATKEASAAMDQWTFGMVTVSLDEVRRIPLEDAGTEMGMGDELLTMVVLTLDDEIGGCLILVFDEFSGRDLAASLLGREPETGEKLSELEQSALNETGNILGCAYVNAISRMIDFELMPSPPYFVQDYGICVLEQAVMAQACTSEELLLCEIGFKRQGKDLDWRVVFVPTPEMEAAIERSLHTA